MDEQARGTARRRPIRPHSTGRRRNDIGDPRLARRRTACHACTRPDRHMLARLALIFAEPPSTRLH